MPSEANHIALANKNQAAMLHLLESEDGHSEWVVTAAFYKAVQITEAALAHTVVSRRHSHSHFSRVASIKRLDRQLYRHYRPLQDMSTVARYLSLGDNHQSYPSFTQYLSSRCASREGMITNTDAIKAFLNQKLWGFECKIMEYLSAASKSNLERFERL